jgi:hypothetical protein
VSLDGRLNRLAPALTPKERGILMLKALKGEIQEDPLWRTTVQPQDYDAVDWYIKLINACSGHFASFVAGIKAKTDEAWMLLNWLDSVLALGLQSWQLALLVPPRARAAADKALARYDRIPVCLPWTDDSQVGWLDLADSLRAQLAVAFTVAWLKLRSAEIVAVEAAAHFDGEDPLRPVTRETLDECRQSLLYLHPVAKVMSGCELKEPDEEWLRSVRFFVDRGKGLLT